MSDPLNDLVATAVRAWASVAGAWIESANAVFVSLLDLSDTESDQLGFNEETVLVPAQPAACAVRAGRFADFDDTPLPAEVISVRPDALGAGVETKVCVRVTPPPGTASGTYMGTLRDSPGGRCVAEEVGVYVVGDRAP
jgi:hypothetical protein